MTTLNLGNHGVIRASIMLPVRGAWTADVLVASDVDTTDDVTMTTASGSLVLNGYRYRGKAYEGSLALRIVGGKGGLRNVIRCKGYQITPALTVAQDIATDAGEALDPTATAVLSSVILKHWARAKGTAERALTALADALGVVWRITAAGLIWFGTDAYTETSVDGVILTRNDSYGEVVYGVDDFDMLPGISIDGRKVQAVTHEVSERGLRTIAHFDGDGDRVRGTIRRLVESSQPATAYKGTYVSKIVTQSGGNLDVVPDSDEVPGLQRVPLFYGVPGLAIQVLPGSRANLGFLNGDASKPFVNCFESGTLLSYKLSCTAAYELTCPSIQLGAASAMPLAHAIETLSALQAIGTALASVHASVSAASPPSTPVTNGTLAAFLAPFATVTPAIAAVTPTLPTVMTRAA